MTDFMKDQKQIKIGDTINFKNLGELEKFFDSAHFKTNNYQYLGGPNMSIKRIS